MKLEQLTKSHHTIPLVVEDEEARRSALSSKQAGGSSRSITGLGSFRGSSRPRSVYSAEEPRFPRRLAFSFGQVPVGIVCTPFSLFSVKRGHLLLQGVWDQTFFPFLELRYLFVGDGER